MTVYLFLYPILDSAEKSRNILQAPGVVGELGVETPFVGGLVFEGSGAMGGDQGVEVGGQALPVGGVVDRHVMHPVPGVTWM